MDEKTHFALTIILAFVIGILFGAGNRVVAEAVITPFLMTKLERL